MKVKLIAAPLIFIAIFLGFLYSPVLAATNVPAMIKGSCGSSSVNTAIGCIDTDIESGGFLRTILSFAIGIGGGIALLLMLYGTFIVTTSAGIPDKLSQGKEIITSAAIGLVFIILSIVLMNLIGVSILGIPGLA